MKKSIKLGLGALAIMGLMTASFFTINKAEAGTTASLKLVISTSGSSTCTLTGEGSWTANTSLSSQTATVVKNVITGNCTLLDSTKAESVKLQGPANLTSSAGNIAISNVKTTNVCTTGATIKGTCGTTSSTSLTTAGLPLFSKTANSIGTVTLKDTLVLTIPAGQPAGTYTGEVSIIIS